MSPDEPAAAGLGANEPALVAVLLRKGPAHVFRCKKKTEHTTESLREEESPASTTNRCDLVALFREIDGAARAGGARFLRYEEPRGRTIAA